MIFAPALLNEKVIYPIPVFIAPDLHIPPRSLLAIVFECCVFYHRLVVMSEVSQSCSHFIIYLNRIFLPLFDVVVMIIFTSFDLSIIIIYYRLGISFISILQVTIKCVSISLLMPHWLARTHLD